MNDNRTGGLLLVAGCVAGLITMGLHPGVSHDGSLPSPTVLVHLAQLDRIVHGLALIGVTMIFLGAMALTRRLTTGNRLAQIALVVYAVAGVAIMVASAMDGFVAADLVNRIAAGDAKLESWRLLLDYNTRIVVAFASVYAIGTCAAIFLWSLAAVRTARLATALGWYGLVLTPVIVLAVFSGHLSMGKHGFGLVTLMQAVWFVAAGCLLMRSGVPNFIGEQTTGKPELAMQ